MAAVYTDEEGQYSITDVTPYAEYRIQGELAHYSTITEDRVYMQEENLQRTLACMPRHIAGGTVVIRLPATLSPVHGSARSIPALGRLRATGKQARMENLRLRVYAQQYILSVEMNGYCEIRDEYTVTDDASDMVFQMEERLTYNVTGLIFEKIFPRLISL